MHNLIEGTRDKSHLKAIATNSVMMKFLMMTLVGDSLNDCLDRLYEHVTNVDVLTRCIEKRFGIDIEGHSVDAMALLNRLNLDPPGALKAEKWGLNGAKRVYACLRRLPSTHVQAIWTIITTNTNRMSKKGVPMASGGSQTERGRIFVDYNEANSDAIVGKVYCDNPKDALYHLPLLDTTVVHEIGHVIDVGERYSGSPDFRAISGWENKGKTDTPSVLRTAIEGCAKVAYPKSLTSDEQAIAHKGAESLITGTITDPGLIKTEVDQAYSDLGKDTRGQAGVRNSLALTKELENCTVYKHILRSWAGEEPWTKGKRTDMNRQIHQGYEKGAWYAFDNAAFSDKISMYQLRDPREEFAELYAAYHVANPKGKGLKQDHKDWFENNHLHQDPPKGEGKK